MDLTDGIKQHVEDKLESVVVITQKFEPCDLRVEVGKTGAHHKSGEIYVAEFNLTIPGTMLRTVRKSEDLYRAIDQATEDLKRQVNKYKQKLRVADRAGVSTEIKDGDGTWMEEDAVNEFEESANRE